MQQLQLHSTNIDEHGAYSNTGENEQNSQELTTTTEGFLKLTCTIQGSPLLRVFWLTLSTCTMSNSSILVLELGFCIIFYRPLRPLVPFVLATLMKCRS